MDTLSKFGRPCFAGSIAFFGVQYLLYGHFVGGLPFVPPWTPGAPLLAHVLGTILILAALSIATFWNARYSAISLGTSAPPVFPVLALPSRLLDSQQWQ